MIYVAKLPDYSIVVFTFFTPLLFKIHQINYICSMEYALIPQNTIYSENLLSILDKGFGKDWCAHVLCHAGTFAMIFNDQLITINPGNLFVSSRLDLISKLQTGPKGCKVEMIIAPHQFLKNLLPTNNYSVEGSICLFDNPIIKLDESETESISTDFQSINRRLSDSSHPFFEEIIGSLCRCLMYDIFAAHIRHNTMNKPTTVQGADIISRLLELLSSGLPERHRTVDFYADKLCVSPKYLSNLVRRHTGQTVTDLINSHALPILSNYLKNTTLTLDQICHVMNFSSPSYLSRYITRHFGMSPKVYRGL